MEKDFENFIITRCEAALMGNDDYLVLREKECDPEEVEDMEHIICYKQGFSDALKIIMKCSQKM